MKIENRYWGIIIFFIFYVLTFSLASCGGGGGGSENSVGSGNSNNGNNNGEGLPNVDPVKTFTVAELNEAADNKTSFWLLSGVKLQPTKTGSANKILLNFQSSAPAKGATLYVFSPSPKFEAVYEHPDLLRPISVQNSTAAKQVSRELGESQFQNFSNNKMLGGAFNNPSTNVGNITLTATPDSQFKFAVEIATTNIPAPR